MTDPNLVILYAADVPASTAFYQKLLGRPPVEAAPTFAMFPLNAATMLGLWTKTEVQPAAAATGGGTEVCFKVADAAAVDSTHADWRSRGLTIAQSPTDMDFGRTFTALDPDGHRLRVYAIPAG